jgi:polyribonucleotide nucleotidyltransferase
MQQKIVHEFVLDGVPFKIEANELGFNTQSALLITYGETSVYITVAVGKADPTLDFFPLTVDYVEKLYAGGIISSSPYIKREGRPTEHEILTGRLVDHAIRSLFDAKFRNEVQVIVQVFSYDKEHDPVLTSIIGVSFALAYSGLPFLGPYGATKVGYINNEIVLNPKLSQMKDSLMEMHVSSVEAGIVSVEAEAHDLADEIIKEAISQAKQHNKFLIEEQIRFVEKYGKKEFHYETDDVRIQMFKELVDEVIQGYETRLENALYIVEKKLRQDAIDAVQAELEEKFVTKLEDESMTKTDILLAVDKVCKKIVRKNIIQNAKRPDGRKIDEVRSIAIQLGILPRVHGSAVFTRGETQTLTIVTLGSERDALALQGLDGESSKNYFHHYNMPGYANGEIDRKFGMPNRRAIGHGAIGEKALVNMLPSMDEFPYTVRVVSEVLASNGSTSMAATCGSTLALMDAGVKLKKMVGGIGVGLVTEEDGSYTILTDIIGLEDFYGDMDFKITGSNEGITAIQLDNKMAGIPLNVLLEAIDQSKKARLHVIVEMEKAISAPREKLSRYAPKVKTLQIKQDKIGELIGPGGKNIKSIIEKTGVEINIEEDGSVKIYSHEGDEEGFEQALLMINGITQDMEIGAEFDAEAVRVENYGVFIEVPNTKIQGMVHVSNLGMGRIDDVRDVVNVGDKLKVKYLGKDEKGRTKFTVVNPENIDNSNARVEN